MSFHSKLLRATSKIGMFGILFLLAGCVASSTTLNPATETPAPTPAATATAVVGIGAQTVQSFELTVDGKTETHDVLLYLPKDYTMQDRWPLIVYLHGANSRGDDIYQLLGDSFPKKLGTSLHIPAIVVAPQAPRGTIWDGQIEVLEALLTAVEARYQVDSEKIVLTGFSMGGFGTWAWGLEAPERFAALVPVAGGSLQYGASPPQLCDLKDTPVWAFASTADTVVPASRTEPLIEGLVACGAEQAQITVYDDASHNLAGTRPYLKDSPLYPWLWQEILAGE